MALTNNFLEIHRFYNLSRYLFLNIDWEYGAFAKNTGITLPQLRVLWIIKIYEGISLGEIAKIGGWSSPTVTKMLQNLMGKNLVLRLDTSNKKQFSLALTKAGDSTIQANQLKKENAFVLFDLMDTVNPDVLESIIEIFKRITISLKNDFLFDYIDKINEMGLKIDYNGFSPLEQSKLEKLIEFYNLLRSFVLAIEGKHRQLLVPFNLTYPQLRSLWIINAFPGITSKQLSEIAYLSPSTVNVIVRNLNSKNLIKKKKSELKNSLFLFITDSGKNLLVKDFELNQKSLLVYSGITFLSPEELTTLNRFLFKLNTDSKNDYVEGYMQKTLQEIEKMT